ncbi:hypothetical protein K504DRAFT_531986 [Pleomassaria siparia CBS 279.74]|uniref:Uncharacterized protein n=1 Tax=Pleomassaria siparia CBS 279.74 TaxID=1314801 RepID=A0A6G1KF35_9PLEO|nr:hypothetical protein K504DRAFT_531986 [Pleomassaria siparia CBS 279.74]
MEPVWTVHVRLAPTPAPDLATNFTAETDKSPNVKRESASKCEQFKRNIPTLVPPLKDLYATLWGLPPGLRLQIYHLCFHGDSDMIHIHHREAEKNAENVEVVPWRFTMDTVSRAESEMLSALCKSQVVGSLCCRAPNLQGIAFQGPTNIHQMPYNGGRGDVLKSQWQNFIASKWLNELPPEMTVAMEAFAWRKRRQAVSHKEEQTRWTIVRWAGGENIGLNEEHCWDEVEVHRSSPVEWKWSAPWRTSWLNKEVPRSWT